MKKVTTKIDADIADRIKDLAARAGQIGEEYEEAIIHACIMRALPEMEHELSTNAMKLAKDFRKSLLRGKR